MYRLTLLIIALIAFNANATIVKVPNYTESSIAYKTIEELELEKTIFGTEEAFEDTFESNSLEVLEVEEEVEINFDTKAYLPEGFNALKGKNDLNWNTIELIEPLEDVELGFETQNHLPKGFNVLQGKNDLDWSSINLIELEEDVELDMDTKAHLPKGFNPYKGMHGKKEVVVCLY